MKSILDAANDVLHNRSVWEQKQRIHYQMRHEGVRRMNKPFPRAADMHFPLVDMLIRKFKPFWLAQALATDRLAAFVALRDELELYADSAADFFDFTLKQQSCFDEKLEVAVDTMLLRGRGIVKATIDPMNDNKLVFQAVDPWFVLMPNTANDFGDTDWFVHVRHLTVGQYKRDPRYNQEVIDRVRGNPDQSEMNDYWTDKEVREGITFSKDSSSIILWEHYEKTPGGYTVRTVSPQAHDAEVRRPFGLPYKYDGKASLPFYSFTMEVKDEGWYSPRGLGELNAPFETYACKIWNEKCDAMTFGNRPVFTADNEIPNAASIRWNPGEFIPGNIKPVVMPQPALSFDQEMAFTRSTAEQLSLMPDFGVMDPNQGTKPRTATETQRISQLMQAGMDHNGRVFRRQLAKLYRHCWGLMLQYEQKDLAYFMSGDLKTLPEQALHSAYLITCDGSPDQWDRAQRFDRAVRRLQLLGNAPNVSQDELVKEVLAADDARLVQKAFIPTNAKAATEAEDEAVEIGVLRDGFPAAVLPGEDHATRIQVLLGWLQKQGMTGAPVDPIAMQRVQQHLAVHWQYLQKTQPEAAQQLKQQLQMQEQQAAMAQQPQPMTEQAA